MSDRRGFDRVIGQELAKRVLSRAARAGLPGHSYLFVGMQGTGKFKTALEFARALNCENQADEGACGACAICRSAEHGNFPDVTVWSPGKVRDTSIEQMREMRAMASFAPVRGRWRVNIVEQGDTLNAEAASCILKLMEEPPDYLVNILLYRNAAAVLPTIRSRCQLVRFTPVGADELASRLVEEYGVDPERAAFLASFSQGRPGAAIGLIEDDEFFARRGEVIAVADALTSGSPWLALNLAGRLRSAKSISSDDEEAGGQESEDDGEAEAGDTRSPAAPDAGQRRRAGVREVSLESLDVLLTWYRDLLAAKLRGADTTLVNADRRGDVVAQAGRYPHAGPLLGAIDSILRARRAIAGNANPQIAVEAMMMSIRGAHSG